LCTTNASDAGSQIRSRIIGAYKNVIITFCLVQNFIASSKLLTSKKIKNNKKKTKILFENQ